MKIYNTADKVIAVIMTAISLYCFWISLTYLDYEDITFNGVVLIIFLFFIMPGRIPRSFIFLSLTP